MFVSIDFAAKTVPPDKHRDTPCECKFLFLSTSIILFPSSIYPCDSWSSFSQYTVRALKFDFDRHRPSYSREQKQLLEDLFNDIVQLYHFQIQKTHVQVIPGKLEGIYSWIAINYVLGRFQSNNTDSSIRLPSN